MTMLKRAEMSGRRFQNPVPTEVGGLRIPLGIFRQLRLQRKAGLRPQRSPAVAPGPFRTDASLYQSASGGSGSFTPSAPHRRQALSPPSAFLRVTWFGHSSTLIEIDGLRVLIDPVWEQRASPFSWLGPKRFFPPTLALEDLPRLDVILISHDHYDHLGRETTRALANLEAAQGARWVTSMGVGTILRDFGVAPGRITELDWTDQVRLRSGRTGAELKLTAVPSRHFSGRKPWNRFETLWSSFVLEGERHKVYYGADSGMWDGFAEIGQRFGPFDLTMLEIGAFNELWKDIHLGPEGAAKAFAAMGGSGLLMPIHWGLFDLALHDWRQPIERMTELADAIGIRLWSPEPGLPTEVVEGIECRSDWWRPAVFSGTSPAEPNRKRAAKRLVL